MAQDAAAPTEYGGPSVLSRGEASSVRDPKGRTAIRPYFEVLGAYEGGITGVTVRQDGSIPSVSSLGGEVSVGALGAHGWKKTTLELDYKGNYRHYFKTSYYNGSDQSLSLSFSRKLTKRLQFSLRESAGTFTRNFNTTDAYSGLDPTFTNSPANELFDGRTLFLNTLGDVTYRKSARLSFNFGGDGFLVRRRSSSLYSVTGYRARGDFAYRLTKGNTLGVAYDFTHYEFNRGFGGSDIQTVSLLESIRLNRTWELALQLGINRVETLGIGQVQIDPVVAAIIGRTVGIQIVYRVNYVPQGSGKLTARFRQSELGFKYERGVSPGNGLFLTSRREEASGSYSYTGIQKWNLGIGAGYDSLGSLARDVGNYKAYRAGAGATYQLTRATHLNTRVDFRRYDISGVAFQRNSYRASIGLAFTPGNVPLSLW